MNEAFFSFAGSLGNLYSTICCVGVGPNLGFERPLQEFSSTETAAVNVHSASHTPQGLFELHLSWVTAISLIVKLRIVITPA